MAATLTRMPAPESYTALRVRQAEAEQFRRLVRQLAARADRDVTQSDALAAAVAYALDHLGDVGELLPAASG